MGLLDRLWGAAALPAEEGEGSGASPRTVLAAAVPLSGPGVQRVNRSRQAKTSEAWQTEAWYFYDAVGELRNPFLWIANAVSQAEIHATELDPATGIPTGPSDDKQAQDFAAQAFGGPSRRPGILRTVALCWQVAGEAWIVIRPRPPKRGRAQPDEWLALSGHKVQTKGSAWQYTDPFTGEIVVLREGIDRLIRIWSPHPADQAMADSSARPAIPVCREIEMASQNITARLQSRIATNGVMIIADEMNIPAATFMDSFMAAAEAGLKNPGQAESQVPLGFNAPGELIANGGAFAHFDLATDFDGQVVELRDNGRDRLAQMIDAPKQVADGTQGEANHWSSWKVEEDTYKIYIEPLLKAIGNGVDEHWYRPALVAGGKSEEQAESFELGWDTTSIVARPDSRETLDTMHDKRLISDEFYMTESGIPQEAMPSEEERTRRFLEHAVTVAPTLLADPNVASALGLDITVAPVAAGVDATVSGGGELETPEPAALPSGTNGTPGTQGDEPEPEDVPDGLVAAAELIVYDALSRAGGRLLTNQNRGQFKTTPREALHTVVPFANDSMEYTRLLSGSLQFSGIAARAFDVSEGALDAALSDYLHDTVRGRLPHSRDRLIWYLRRDLA